jgi:hypothetical protein
VLQPLKDSVAQTCLPAGNAVNLRKWKGNLKDVEIVVFRTI